MTALLLFLIGDPTDTPRMYGAKFRTGDMDLRTGFDAQATFGAGKPETLHWLLENGYTDEHAHLSEWSSQWEDPSIEEQRVWHLRGGPYFMPSSSRSHGQTSSSLVQL